MTIQLDPIDGPLGTVVTGVDLRSPLTAQDRDAVRAALTDRLLVVFPGQHLDLDAERRFGASLGPLWHHPGAAGAHDGASAVLDSHRAPGGGRAADVWHADATFTAAPPAYTMLSAQVVPDRGGATSFANQQAAYEFVDSAWRERLETLRAVHLPGRLARQRAPWLTGATHPVVRVDPVTGRRSLFVNPGFTRRFEDLSPAASRPGLRYLFQLALAPPVCWDHHWSEGELVVWDNRALLHRAHHDFGAEARVMTRVTVAA
jgi:alpha-ketoglutarate-dependent taurine dioxygenase